MEFEKFLREAVEEAVRETVEELTAERVQKQKEFDAEEKATNRLARKFAEIAAAEKVSFRVFEAATYAARNMVAVGGVVEFPPREAD